MPLRITLKPEERLIINGACLKNGGRSANILIENQCAFLRESEIVRECDADTACKKLLVVLQVIYIANQPPDAINLFFSQAADILRAFPSTAPYLIDIQQHIDEGRYHQAIKRGKELVAYEKTLLSRLAA